jgi:hypothetical protein
MKTCKKCSMKFKPTKGLVSYCSLKCRNSRTFSDEAKLKKSIANKGNPKCATNKGKFGHLNPNWKGIGVQSFICNYCKNPVISKYTIKRYHRACWLKLSGGNQKGSGRGKHGWYKGIWCDSSYELAWVIYQLDHDIPFSRNTQSYEYTFNGKQYQYYPDFIQDGKIIEIKGFVNEQTLAKIKSVPDLVVLMRDDLKKEFEYVISTYGKDFIRLYEFPSSNG